MPAHECPHCTEEFDAERGVRMHAWDAHGGCHLCAAEFGDKEDRYRHWLDQHDDYLSDAARKRAERVVGDRTVCPVCSERLESENVLQEHTWEDHEACHLCGASVDDRSELHTHWLVSHPREISDGNRQRAMDDVGEPDFGERLEHGGAITALRGIELDRRAVFTAGAVAVGGALTYGLATGLTGGNDSGGGNTIDTHPATRDVDSQPIMGPSLGDGTGTIVAFEDPFCPSCRHFELQSFPTLKREYIDPGDLSFVYRGIPVVTRYSDVGVHALEATFDRSPEAFWQLKRGYYENQPDIRAGNVESKTESILQSIDDIDVASTMEDVRNRQYQGAVQADMSASRDAGVRGTPTFALFRDGSYVTQLSGAQSAATLANSVGL